MKVENSFTPYAIFAAVAFTAAVLFAVNAFSMNAFLSGFFAVLSGIGACAIMYNFFSSDNTSYAKAKDEGPERVSHKEVKVDKEKQNEKWGDRVSDKESSRDAGRGPGSSPG